eukprot:CAMPEP_0174332768 /NCGR_PEP_ID=MMETSP0810-20121108/18571_1 /TAXON_ID=73025 ORGANISM="Eutreptiella gymnastica-like, Strain CCMP1594" /NCGR_SAMPLE_ID=MMETSP0810 /ASSEMBLY_ACC=CAM_ASM_000659 /LENGTH=44 /DNA_ID= /DNA_START= /DNA_END= /DNA_ORIENTATION=
MTSQRQEYNRPGLMGGCVLSSGEDRHISRRQHPAVMLQKCTLVQ